MRADIIPLLSKVEKPGRYTGGEIGAVYKNKQEVSLRAAFCFPDVYEIGMSNLGMKILCGVLNEMEGVWCERVFAPWPDMEELMREHGIPLFTHESGDSVGCFDIVAFTLQYELCYTNVLNMLDLAGIPLKGTERCDDDPIVIAGGHSAMNPEPMADFIDIFSIGEGEEALPELCTLYMNMKESGGYTREKFLRAAARLDGFYVPSLYDVSYGPDGVIEKIVPKYEDVPARVRRRVIADLDSVYFPTSPIVPNIETVHDRVTLEVFRGCVRGCRFCQAGFICRPVREKSPEVLCRQARECVDATGYDEISMCCLSISDYSEIGAFTDGLLRWTDDARVNISLPSLRADSFTKELMDKISSVRTSTLTFAPEAGSARLRDVINKNIDESDILKAAALAFSAGKNQVKLYFMNGLPHETDDDIRGIASLAENVIKEYYRTPDAKKSRTPQVTLSVACFIPKPHTPFEREGQALPDELERKQRVLSEAVRDRRIRYNYHDAKVSRIEAVFARGDRRLGEAVLAAVRSGMKFDAWTEFFDYDRWMAVFADCGLDPAFYANRTIPDEETLPWDVIDCGVTKEFLLRERHRAAEAASTPSCMEKCSACGADSMVPAEVCRWCHGGKKRPVSLPSEDCGKMARSASSPKPDPALAPVRTVRVRFTKTGPLAYIGHLDLMNTVSRMIIRSGLPVWYTEGFNPHPKLVFSPPLSVGHAGLREIFDVKLVSDVPDDEIVSALRHLAPEGMEILEARTASGKPDAVRWAENMVTLHSDGGDLPDPEDVEKMFEAPVVVMKKSKSGQKEVDITTMIKSLSAERDGNAVKITAVSAAGGDSFLNPSYIAAAVRERFGLTGGYAEFCRGRLLLSDGVTEI